MPLPPPEFSFARFQRATQPLLVKPTTSTRTYPLPLFWTWFFPDPKHCWSLKSPLVVKLECKVSKTNQETHDTKHPVPVRNLMHRSGKIKEKLFLQRAARPLQLSQPRNRQARHQGRALQASPGWLPPGDTGSASPFPKAALPCDSPSRASGRDRQLENGLP